MIRDVVDVRRVARPCRSGDTRGQFGDTPGMRSAFLLLALFGSGSAVAAPAAPGWEDVPARVAEAAEPVAPTLRGCIHDHVPLTLEKSCLTRAIATWQPPVLPTPMGELELAIAVAPPRR